MKKKCVIYLGVILFLFGASLIAQEDQQQSEMFPDDSPMGGEKQYSIFVKIGSLQGESMDSKHIGWIDAEAIHHEIHAPGETNEPVEHLDFSIIKHFDKTTPVLNKHVCQHHIIPNVTVDITVNTGMTTTIMRYILENVIIRTITISANPMENFEEIHLSYEKIEWIYTPLSDTGSPSGSISTKAEVIK